MAGRKGRSGRPRKPTQLKIVQGTYQKCRATPDEPQPDTGIPKYTRGLSKESKYYWDKVGAELHQMRIITKADRWLLRLICDALANYDEEMKVLKKEGKTITKKDKHGNSILFKNPRVKIVRDLWNCILIALREFGLTPSSRTRISVIPNPDEDNPWENL